MAKVVVIFNHPTDIEGFEHYFKNVHLQLVHKLPNLKRAEIHRVAQTFNNPEPLYLIAELHFDSVEIINQTAVTPEGAELQGDVANMLPYLSKPPVMAIVD